MKFTRREKHVLIISLLALLGIFLSGSSQQEIEEFALAWLFFFVVPLGIYIVTDPERRQVG